MTTYYNDYSSEFQKALRYDKYDRRQYGRVTFHTGYKVDTPGTASDGIIRCHKLALVISSKFWRDVLEFSGNENVDIFVCDYSKEFIEAYVTLCERGETKFTQDIQNEDFESFVENTKQNRNAKEEFKVSSTTCPHCLKFFSNPRTCRKHIKSYHGEEKDKKYDCNICQRQFKTKNGLKSHIENDHNSKDPFQCLTCNKVYQNRNELKRHSMLEGHSYPKRRETETRVNKDEQCQVCFKKVGLGSMQRHMEKYHSEKSRTWICDECGRSFKRKDSLFRHRKIVHNFHMRSLTAVEKLYDEDNMIYKCPECKRTFDDKEDAIDHIIQSRCNMECDICGKQFRLTQHLKRHRKIHDKSNKSD